MLNNTASFVVDKYLTNKNPRYALLVDAPWGSGKTHFIERATNYKSDETRLYVSLYNVHNTEDFDWALVRALQPWAVDTSGKWTGRFKEIASAVQIFGCSVDLTKVNLTELVLNKLPETLIFDDIERCGLSPKQLWGLINRFVEHEEKRVILIVNSVKHINKPEFLETREKLVGQVVQIQADVDGAMASAWVNIPSGEGQKFLQNHQAAIRETFEEAGHQNLRLLLRAMRDAANLINDIDKQMIAFDKPMERLLRSFLALHMAYHNGDISKEDLKNRGEIASFRNSGKPAESTPLSRLAQNHPKANISTYSGSTLPVELAYSTIADGFASKDDINTDLNRTQQFVESTEKPDWVRFRDWFDETEDELHALELRIDQRMQNHEITNPGEILLIFAAKNSMGNFLEDYCPKKNVREFYNYETSA